jgi:hypothetical protein
VPPDSEDDYEGARAIDDLRQIGRLMLDRNSGYHLQQGKPGVTGVVDEPRMEHLRRNGNSEVCVHAHLTLLNTSAPSCAFCNDSRSSSFVLAALTP